MSESPPPNPACPALLQRIEKLENRFSFLWGGIVVAGVLLIGSGFVVNNIVEDFKIETRQARDAETEFKNSLTLLKQQVGGIEIELKQRAESAVSGVMQDKIADIYKNIGSLGEKLDIIRKFRPKTQKWILSNSNQEEKNPDLYKIQEEGHEFYKLKLIKTSDGYCMLSAIGQQFKENFGLRHGVEIRDDWWVASISIDNGGNPWGFTVANCYRYLE